MSGPKSDETASIIADIENLKNVDVVKQLSTYQEELIHLGIDWGGRLVAAIIILIIGWMLGNWINRRFENLKRMDSTLKNFLGAFFKYSIIFLSVITVIGVFGIPMASLLAVLGAAGLAIGLALQGTLSNVAAGVMLLILRPFNVGDYIEFGAEGGTVKSLGLFGTELAKADNVYLFAPNSKIWGNEIRNYSRNMTRRQDILVSVSYDDDLTKAVQIIHAVLDADERVMQEPENHKPQVVSDTLGDYSTNLIVRFWASNADYWALRWDMTQKIKDALENAGISLPLTTRQLAISSNEV